MKQNEEMKRMNELAFGKKKTIIGEAKAPSKKSKLNEHVVGTPAINSPFMKREKTDYEVAFEHFTNSENNNAITENEDLRAENALLRETINSILAEEEIDELFSKFKKKALSPEEAMEKGKQVVMKDAGKRNMYNTINKTLGGAVVKKYLEFVGNNPSVKYPKYMKDQGDFVDGTKYSQGDTAVGDISEDI